MFETKRKQKDHLSNEDVHVLANKKRITRGNGSMTSMLGEPVEQTHAAEKKNKVKTDLTVAENEQKEEMRKHSWNIYTL